MIVSMLVVALTGIALGLIFLVVWKCQSIHQMVRTNEHDRHPIESIGVDRLMMHLGQPFLTEDEIEDLDNEDLIAFEAELRAMQSQIQQEMEVRNLRQALRP